MDYRTLGRTGLRVSVMGLGTGGPSNFGQSTGVPEAEIKRLVRRALDLGINFFDTSAAYKESESILGRVLEGVPRDQYILATKFHATRDDWMATPEDLAASVDRSLERLKVDSVEIMQFHGVAPEDYRKTIDGLMPTVLRHNSLNYFHQIQLPVYYTSQTNANQSFLIHPLDKYH